jgi:hypothetical protein
MAGCSPASPLTSEFNEFLFAPVCEDRNEMPLSVLSALARLDIDAWREAAELARLPGEAAAERLASLIETLPEGPSGRLDASTVAVRLIMLLPRGGAGTGPSSSSPAGRRLKNLGAAIINYLIIMGSVVAVQCFLANRQSPADAANGRSQISSTARQPDRPVSARPTSNQRSSDPPRPH